MPRSSLCGQCSRRTDAFREYWAKLSGEAGHLVDCGIVAGAVSVAFHTAGGLVLTSKMLVIGQLVAHRCRSLRASKVVIC